MQKESGGWFEKFTDEQLLAAQKMLSQYEGVFCEPASAASLAGALHDISLGKIPEGSVIVCTLTGNGIKDPEIAMQQCASAKPVTIEASLEAVKRAILDYL